MFYLINKNLKLLYFIIFLFVYIVFNKYISNMALTGITVNLIGIIILVILLIKNNHLEYLLLFFMLNIMIGPFLVINFRDINLSSIGRLDFFIANLLFLYFIFNKGRNILFPLIADILISLSCFINYNNLLENFSIYYSYISKISIGYILYYFWINFYKYKSKLVMKLLFYLLLFHVSVSIIQFFYPIYFRVSSSESNLYFLGHLLNRPLGILAASFVYGVTSLVVLGFYIRYKQKINLIDKILILFLLFTSFISTRSIVIGILLYILYLIYKKKRVLFWLLLFLGTYIVVHNFAIQNIDNSNKTKIILWYLSLYDIINNSDLLQILFGHGIETATILMDSIPNFERIHPPGVSYNGDMLHNRHIHLHNIFIQMLYEQGIIVFLFFIYFLFKIINFILNKTIKINIKLEVLLFFIILSNYFLHNGIYSYFLIFIILVFLDYIKRYRLGLIK